MTDMIDRDYDLAQLEGDRFQDWCDAEGVDPADDNAWDWYNAWRDDQRDAADEARAELRADMAEAEAEGDDGDW